MADLPLVFVCPVALGIVTPVFRVVDDMHALVADLLLRGRFHALADVRRGDVGEVPNLVVVPAVKGQVVSLAAILLY